MNLDMNLVLFKSLDERKIFVDFKFFNFLEEVSEEINFLREYDEVVFER